MWWTQQSALSSIHPRLFETQTILSSQSLPRKATLQTHLSNGSHPHGGLSAEANMRKRCDYRNCISDRQTLLSEGSKELWNKMPGRGCSRQLVAMCVGTLRKGMKRARCWLMHQLCATNKLLNSFSMNFLDGCSIVMIKIQYI